MKEEFVDRFTKTTLIEKGVLKDNQKGKYVLYYIFYHEIPIYVGVTNNFESRKSQHFGDNYRAREYNKKLYKHMDMHAIEDYSMYIVAQSRSAEGIEGMEKQHIKELKEIGLAETNVSMGGNYVKHYDMTEMILRDFYYKFRLSEKRFLKNNILDIKLMEDEIKEVDWSALYSIVDCWEHDISRDYEYFLKAEKYEYEDCSLDMYMRNNLSDRIYSPHELLTEVITGERSIPKNVKEESLELFMRAIHVLQNLESPLDVYLGLKILMGANYEDDIAYIVEDIGHEYEVCKLIEIINPFLGTEGEFDDVDFIY